MARTREYQHFCPVARSLEVIGEKWSLLIVRDLLRGPQRFTDLRRFLGGITPKWLTLRLRDLEAAGIVERDSKVGRREVWYRLTVKGRDLAPVVEALAVWGIDYARRPPLPGEPINPEQSLSATTVYRNRRGIRLSSPATWVLHFGEGRVFTLGFDGDRWFYRVGNSPADVTVATTLEIWVAFLMAESPELRRYHADGMRIAGDDAHVEEFLHSFGAVPAVGAAGG